MAMADEESLHLTQVGNVRLKVIPRTVESTMMLVDVYLASRLAKTIVFYGKLQRKCFALVYDGENARLIGAVTVPSPSRVNGQQRAGRRRDSNSRKHGAG